MIHQIRIRNFKSILDATVNLSPVTVLVGRSGTGKTNFVEAIRFLRDLLSSKEMASKLNNQWPMLRPATAPDSTTSFEVSFSVGGVEEQFRYQLSLSNHGLQQPPLSESLHLGSYCLFHQQAVSNNLHSAQWVVEPQVEPIPPPGPYALGRIPSSHDVVIAYTVLTGGIGCYAFSDQVLSENKSNTSSMGLDDSATNYLTAMKEVVSNLQNLHVRKGMVSALQRVNETVLSVELNDLQQPSHIVVGHKFNGKALGLKLSQESAGFRRFFAHLLALYQSPPKQTLIFEHPEDGIHPGALSLLAEEFEAAPRQQRGQVILTTHSPKLLDHFQAEQIRVVELDGLQTRIGPISLEQQEAIREDLLDAGELLTVDPARLQAATEEEAAET